jgi:hypothetical protein
VTPLQRSEAGEAKPGTTKRKNVEKGGLEGWKKGMFVFWHMGLLGS